MKLHTTAKKLAARGRNGDTTLVHMAPEEVRGLAALAKAGGTELTTNPDTGLVEAFSLKSMLPMLAGAAGMAFGIPPMVTAGALGGLTALQSGDLGKGLAAGLGAYGGGNLASGLLGAGGLGATDVAKMSADQYADFAANGGAPAGPLGVLSNLGSGGDWKSLAKSGLMGIAPALLESGDSGNFAAGTTRQGQIRPYELQRNNQSGQVDTGSSAERRYFDDTWVPKYAEGGIMQLAGGGVPALTPSSIDPYMSSAQEQNENLAHGGQAYAHGGIASLGDYSDGGQLLRGPGDGVSDSIPANIGGKRPARLADGEFVVPARVVSELGNGSTEAGSRQLYAMMERVQNARKKTVGKNKVAVDAKAAKHLPA